MDEKDCISTNDSGSGNKRLRSIKKREELPTVRPYHTQLAGYDHMCRQMKNLILALTVVGLAASATTASAGKTWKDQQDCMLAVGGAGAILIFAWALMPVCTIAIKKRKK